LVISSLQFWVVMDMVESEIFIVER
jgi:hypothetical protein